MNENIPKKPKNQHHRQHFTASNISQRSKNDASDNDELNLLDNIKNFNNTKKLNLILNNNNNKNMNFIQYNDNIKSYSKSNKMPKLNLLLTFIIGLVLISMPTITNATDLQENLNEDIKLTLLDKTETYISSTAYYPRGMGPLYNATNKILDWFIGKDAIPENYIIVSENGIDPGPKVKNNDWGDLLKHYWGILLIVCITALLVVLMPIIGLCFCCCRCAGSCGGRSQPFDKKHDTCRRVCLGFLLIILTSGLLFGVVITFATNSYIQEGVDDSTDTIRKGSQDISTFLKSTSDQLDHLIVYNFRQVSSSLLSELQKTSSAVVKELQDQSKAISLVRLTKFVKKFPEIQDNLGRMKAITNELRVNASQLSDGLRGVKRELLTSLTKCNTQGCKQVLNDYQIGKLDANGIDYNQLPDNTDIIQDVDNLKNSGVAEAVDNGNKAIKDIRESLSKTIETNIPKINEAITKSAASIDKTKTDLTSYMDSISKMLIQETNFYTREADKYLNEYKMYRFYVGIGISSVLLLVLCSLICALLCGVCGKRPGGYGDDCCNKGSGARFLMLAVAVIFLTISVLAIVALLHFLIGLALHRGVCVPLNNPEGDQIFGYLDSYIDLNKFFNKKVQIKNKQIKNFQNTGSLPPFRISSVITSCQANETIYKVLKLQNQVDIEHIRDMPNEYGIYDTLDKLKKDIKIDTTDIKLLTKEDKEKIEKLKDSKLKNFNADQIFDNVEGNVTKYNLVDIANRLRQVAETIKANNKMMEISVSLKNQALHLETYQRNLVEPMLDHSKELIELAKNLQTNLKLEGNSFEESVQQILDEIENAEKIIKEQGNSIVQVEATKLVEFFKKQIEKYIGFVITSIEKDVSRCGPVSNVYASGTVLVCNKIVDPLNGFWAGLKWSILLFIPILIVSVKLSSLYQKSDPYPGPLVESEYLYDAYSERDNIPLANGPKNKRRKKDRSRDRRGDYYEESTSHGPVGTGGRDGRYNDMAPKHWDGGPPRYTNPPMAPPASEYERPPPYYYPGASEHE